MGSWPNALTFAPYTLLQGQGRPAMTATIHVAQMVPYILLLLVLIPNSPLGLLFDAVYALTGVLIGA